MTVQGKNTQITEPEMNKTRFLTTSSRDTMGHFIFPQHQSFTPKFYSKP